MCTSFAKSHVSRGQVVVSLFKVALGLSDLGTLGPAGKTSACELSTSAHVLKNTVSVKPRTASYVTCGAQCKRKHGDPLPEIMKNLKTAGSLRAWKQMLIVLCTVWPFLKRHGNGRMSSEALRLAPFPQPNASQVHSRCHGCRGPLPFYS